MNLNLPETHKKELVSLSYLHALVTSEDYLLYSQIHDYGVDITIQQLSKRPISKNRSEYFPNSREIDAQVKAVKSKRVPSSNGHITYPLRAKNYRDLVSRQTGIKPLILFLVVLPNDEEDWVKLNVDEICVRKNCFYYLANGLKASANEHTVSIDIPTANIVGKNTIRELFKLYFGEDV